MYPQVRTVPVLAVLVCHDGEQWLRLALSALRRSTPRPRHVIAVDTGSTDGTPKLLATSDDVLDGVLTLDRSTGFGAAVKAAFEHAVERWGDPGGWIWLLHDDCAPEPDCLAALMTAAELSQSAGVLGPVALDWSDPRLVVEAGLSTDASGHRQTGIGSGDLVRISQSSEVLAVPSAGLLVRRDLWEELGGFDPALPLVFDDIDFGWRANRSGAVALCVPAARIRHARAMTRGVRTASADAQSRAHGIRTFLVNCAFLSFVTGVPRLAVLCLLRGLGFTLLRRISRARAEFVALGRLLGGRMKLLRGRRDRRKLGGSVGGLFTSRFTRLRNMIRAGVTQLVRRRVEADVALGQAPEKVWVPPEELPRPVGPDALPAGALGRKGQRLAAGLRRPASAVVVPVLPPLRARKPSPRPRPSPVPRDGSAVPEVMLVEVDRGRVLKQILLAPPLLLVLGLLVVGLAVNRHRLSLDLVGGRLLPMPDIWPEYLAAWHAVDGGTASPAPTALAVLGILGGQAGLLLLADMPLAGLGAYLATRRLPVRRGVRAVIAGVYALLPPATAAVAQGRLDAVVVHILLPPVLAGVVSVLVRGSRSWLSLAAGSSLGLAVIGAFSPLTHLLILVCALGGFVLAGGQRGDGPRRGAALFAIVLLPLALLLPWPAVLIQHPGALLHGVGAWVPEQTGLGPGALPVLGLVVAVVAVAGLVFRPGRGSLPGLGLLVLGLGAVAVVRLLAAAPVGAGAPQHGWLGTPLIIVGWGLLWALAGSDLRPRPAMTVGAVGLAVLVAGAFIAGRDGPLTAGEGVQLASSPGHELADTGRGVLVMSHGNEPVRLAAGRMPAFGDDDLVAVASAESRIRRWDNDLRSPTPEIAKPAVASAAAAGVLFVVMPDQATSDRLRTTAGDLVSPAGSTSDGRPTLRLQPAAGLAVLLAPELAKQAVTGGTPPTALGAGGIVPVDARPPDVAVRVSDGSEGRLLVIGAAEEPGWRAEVNGRQVPVVRAWGNLVGVAVPARSADVRIEYSSTLRAFLLLLQGAALLFTLLTAIPARRR
ncbi:GT2 family glycosyltransferase [Kibdelosporangium banguiense]|uniref:GT2 family glycosyltransferase n=1 Tax=Kibdelosporangium banguiense TaxID=1365924 RepID=A0ABS4TEM5_9PSEU|nr:glycosyltransferase [Kibdelosporangium banguiense]MBP2322858.1 GT2 family glycosyltransferase [Kibdelosporangium banguiense]